MQNLRVTHKPYSVFEMLACLVNGFHINTIFMHNADFKSAP